MNFDFIEVFTRAAKITWKYKVLWIFGILASCGKSNGGNSNSSNRSGDGNGNNPFTPEMMGQMENFFERVGGWFEQNTWVIFAIIAFVILLIVLQIFFSLVGTAGLARGVVRVENGAESLLFGELFSESLVYFWRLFWAGIIIWLPFFIVFMIVFLVVLVPAASSGLGEAAMGGAVILLVISLCCCLFPISIALNLYHFQVKRSITVEDMGVFNALARGWQVLSKNIIILLIIGVVLFIASFIIGIIIALPVLLLVFPIMGMFVQGNITSWQPFILVGIFILCYSPIAWLVTGILTTYTESVWTLAYMRLVKPAENTPVFVEGNA